MKKSKHQVIEISQKKSSRRITTFFLLLRHLKPSQAEWLRRVMDGIAKSNLDPELLMIYHPGDTIPREILEIANASEGERIRLLEREEASLSDLLKNEAKGDFLVSLHGLEVNLQHLIVQLSRVESNEVFVASGLSISGDTKLSAGQKISRALFHWVARWCTPIHYKYSWVSPYAVPLSHASVFNDIDLSEGLVSQHYDLMLAHPQVKEELDVQLDKKTASEGLLSTTLQTKWLAVKKRVDWFIRKPLKEPADFLNANSPFYRTLFAISSMVLLTLMCAVSFDYGITWDEKIQYEYAKDILKYFLSFGEDRAVFDDSKHLYDTMRYYGSSFDLLTVIVNELLGVTGNEYETRHFLNAVCGFVAMLYTALIARELSGNWRTAFFALLLIALTPSFFGHSMNNPKDIPFASAMVFGLYQLIRLIHTLPKPGFTRISLLILGIGAAISVRIGGLLIIAFMGAFMFMAWLIGMIMKGAKTGGGLIWPYTKVFLITALGGYLLGLVCWPFGLEDPITHPYLALKGFSNVNYLTTYELFEGNRIWMNEIPWYYIPKFMGITIPLLILAGFALSLVFLFLGTSAKQKGTICMLLFFLIFPIAYAIQQDSMLYNGWRHFLFVYPAIVVLSAFFWDRLIAVFKSKALQWSLFILFLIGNGRVMVWMIKSHPNQYIYFNELVGGLKGAYADYEIDYYSNSLKQAGEWLCANENMDKRSVTIVSNNEPLTSEYYIKRCNDSAKVEWVREYELNREEADYAIFTTRTMSSKQILNLFPPKGTLHTINVDGVPICAVVKRENRYLPIAYRLMDSSDYDSAIYYIQKYLAYDTMNEEAYRMAGLTYLNMGEKYLDTGEKCVNRSLYLYPENFMGWDVKGMIYFTRKDYENAEKFFGKSTEYKVNYTSAHYNRGVSLFNLGRYEEGVLEFRNAIRYGGHKFHFYKMLGISYVYLDDWANAVKHLEYAVTKLNGGDIEALEMLASAYYEYGDEEMANYYYEQAQKLKGE